MSKFKKLFDDSRAGFREQPETAAVVSSTESRLIHGFRSSIEARQFRFFADEPEALGGADSAPNPVEYLLAALATCQEVTYRLYADALGIPVDGISISLGLLAIPIRWARLAGLVPEAQDTSRFLQELLAATR